MSKGTPNGTIGYELETAPDLIEPRIGWRAWYLSEHGDSKELVLKAYYKESVWMPGGAERNPVVAECHGGRGHKPVETTQKFPMVRPFGYMKGDVPEEKAPQVPVEGCQCGIYASADPEWTLKYATTGLRDRVLQSLVDSISLEELKDIDYTKFSQSMSVKEAVGIILDICEKRGDTSSAEAILEKRLPAGYAEMWRTQDWHGDSLPPQAVFGTVNLWGKVIKHDTGWRASHAYPKELFLSREHYGAKVQELADDLAERYGIPVTLVDNWAEVVEQHQKLQEMQHQK